MIGSIGLFYKDPCDNIHESAVVLDLTAVNNKSKTLMISTSNEDVIITANSTCSNVTYSLVVNP